MHFNSILKNPRRAKDRFEILEQEVRRFCLKNRVQLIYVFGSCAGGQAGPLSDLDLAYLAQKEISWEEEARILNELIDIFREEAIDLVNLKKAPLTLVHRILKEGKCLYASSPQARIDFETKKEAEYYDTAPLRKEYFDKMLEKLQDGTFWH